MTTLLDNISSKATTASIDKWMPDSHTSDEAPKWLDGPIMKLHRKDIEDEVGIDLSLKDGIQVISIRKIWIRVLRTL